VLSLLGIFAWFVVPSASVFAGGGGDISWSLNFEEWHWHILCWCATATPSRPPSLTFRGAGRVSGQGGQNSARSAEKKFSFPHPGFQFAHPAIRNGCPPCPPYRGGFKGKGLVCHLPRGPPPLHLT